MMKKQTFCAIMDQKYTQMKIKRGKKVITCSKCGYISLDGSSKCDNCGQSFGPTPQPTQGASGAKQSRTFGGNPNGRALSDRTITIITWIVMALFILLAAKIYEWKTGHPATYIFKSIWQTVKNYYGSL